MFFDSKPQSYDIKGILCDLAREQQRLFRQNSREASAELWRLKESICKTRSTQRKSYGICWWDMPWEQIFDRLKKDTEWDIINGRDGWDWECSLGSKIEEGNGLIYLQLHGRKYAGAVVEEEWRDYEKSRYSSAERAEMVTDYNKNIDRLELVGLAASDGPVYSSLNGKAYDSMASYLFSADHFVLRSLCSDIYESSLYTSHTVHNMRIQSNTKHCRKIYRVAEIHQMQSGIVDAIRPGRLELLVSQGEVSSSSEPDWEEKDALLLCVRHMMDHKMSCSVPTAMLCGELDMESGTLDNAVRQAELVTCLAHTIKV